MHSVGAASRSPPALPQQELVEGGISVADVSGIGTGTCALADFTDGLPAVAPDDDGSRRGLAQRQSEVSLKYSVQTGSEPRALDNLLGADEGDDETVKLEGQMAWFSMKDVARIRVVNRRCYIDMTEVDMRRMERDLQRRGLCDDAG